MGTLAPRTQTGLPQAKHLDKDLMRLERLEREAFHEYARVVIDTPATDTERTDALACALAATESVLAYKRAQR